MFIIYYLIGINVLTFLAYGLDKWKAKHLKFVLGLPLILLAQVALAYFIYTKLL